MVAGAKSLSDLLAGHEYPDWHMLLRGANAWMEYKRYGDSSALRSVMSECVVGGNAVITPPVIALAASELGRNGEALPGLEIAEKVLEKVQRSGIRWFEADLHRLKGVLLYQVDPSESDSAQESIRQAIAVAKAQGAKMLELRASTSLAQILRARSSFDDAKDLLGPIYSSFTEGFDSMDLKEAKSVLDELNRMQ